MRPWLGTILHPYCTDEPVHLAYHEANRAAGRKVRWRARFQRLADPVGLSHIEAASAPGNIRRSCDRAYA